MKICLDKIAPQIAALGFSVQDVRDIGLRGHPDDEVIDAAIAADAIIAVFNWVQYIKKLWNRR